MRVGRSCIVGGHGLFCSEPFRPISCHPKFRVIDLPSFGRAQPLIESLSQRLKMSAVWNYKKNKVTQVRVCGRAGQWWNRLNRSISLFGAGAATLESPEKKSQNAKYTVFKSKWQIVNLCSSKTTGPKAFKFSVNVGNNWPFCHAKTQILLLNSLGVIKALKSYQFYGKNQFVPANLGRIFFLLLHFSWLSKLDPWGWS